MITSSLRLGLLAAGLICLSGCGEDKAPTPAPGALAPAAAPQNLYERLGGQEGLEAVIDALLVKAGV